jgi:hypothetical protein
MLTSSYTASQRKCTTDCILAAARTACGNHDCPADAIAACSLASFDHHLTPNHARLSRSRRRRLRSRIRERTLNH